MQYQFGLLPNLFGFSALVLYVLTLLPGIIRTVLPQYRTKKWSIYLLRHRRNIGILAFFVVLIHGILIGYTRQLNFLDPAVILKYIQGITTFTIFTLLAITSNDYSVHHLKHNWRRLHSLTYVAIFILVWHILDKMYGHWSGFTYISLLLLFITVCLFMYRMLLHYKNQKSSINTSSKPS
jgi:methionine sulfoxide reductase heme-binding subunit